MAIDTLNPGIQSDSQASATPGGQPDSAPQPLKLSNDSLIQIEGQEKPVKFSDYTRGFQSTATKAAQERARLAEKYSQLEATLKEREEAIRRYEAAQRQSQVQPGQTQPDELIQAIESLQYLDGPAAGRMLKAIRAEIGKVSNSFGQRDQAIALLYQQLMSMKEQVGQLSGRTKQADFDSKIKGVVNELGYGEEYEDLAKEIYLAYEGDDLDSEFPEILRKRVEQIETAIRKRDKAKVEQSRTRPFTPGRGGIGQASKPLDLRGKTAAEIADIVYSQIEGGSET